MVVAGVYEVTVKVLVVVVGTYEVTVKVLVVVVGTYETDVTVCVTVVVTVEVLYGLPPNAAEPKAGMNAKASPDSTITPMNAMATAC